jgi:hypothetical protein
MLLGCGTRGTTTIPILISEQPTALPAELLSPKSERRESGATIRPTRLIIGWGAAQRSNLGSACHVIYSDGVGYLHSAVIICVLRAACVPGLRPPNRVLEPEDISTM